MELGLDVGYNATKMVTDKGAVTFLSEVGTLDRAHFDVRGALLGDSLDGYTIALRLPRPVLVGAGAVEQSRYHIRRQDRGWITSDQYRDLVLAAMTEATPATYAELVIVTGLPVMYYTGDRDMLHDLLLGEHKAQRDDRHAQTFKVTEARVIPQGMGSLLSVCLDDRGNLVNPDLARGRVGLVDIGGKTTNLLSINRLSDVSRETASIDLGAWSLVDAIKPWLADHYPDLTLRDHETMAAIRTRTLRYRGDPVDLAATVAGLVAPMAEQIIAEATHLWNGAAGLDAILIAGGGAHLLGAAIAAHFGKQARVIDGDPVLSNAAGYYRFAKRLAKG